MEKIFDRKKYEYGLNTVYSFHRKCFNTIVDTLKKCGDIKLTKKEQDDFTFCYLDMEGDYRTLAIRLNDKKDDFYLETVSESGDKYSIDWRTINNDMIITEMLMEKCFEVMEKKNK